MGTPRVMVEIAGLGVEPSIVTAYETDMVYVSVPLARNKLKMWL